MKDVSPDEIIHIYVLGGGVFSFYWSSAEKNTISILADQCSFCKYFQIIDFNTDYLKNV